MSHQSEILHNTSGLFSENFVESGEIGELEELLSFESLYTCANQEIQREQNQRNHYQINYRNILIDLQNFVNEIPNEVNAKKLKYITLFLKNRFHSTYIKINELQDLNSGFTKLLEQYELDLNDDAEKEFKDKYYNFETVTILIDIISLMKNSFFFMELYEDFTQYEDELIKLEGKWQQYFDKFYERKSKTKSLKKKIRKMKSQRNSKSKYISNDLH